MMRVLLLHGFGGTPALWDPVVARLKTADVAIACPVLPGHGPSPADMEGDFDATVHRLWERHEPAIVVGYSLGGRLALGMAAQRPTVRALLVGAHPGLCDPTERGARCAWEAEQAAMLRAQGVVAFMQTWERQPLFASQSAAQREQQRAARSSHTAEGLAWAMERLGLGHMQNYRAKERGPCRWLSGALDIKFSALAAEVGESHRVVPGVGHNVVLEAPAVVAQELLEQLHILRSGQTSTPP